MEINRNNYETYFLDYLEGKLDERLIDSFIEFIKLNPDLKEELALFESLSAVPETILFTKKDKLYKEKYDSEEEFNAAAIASLEGDISTKEKCKFERYLANRPEKKKEAALFTKTKLMADESIFFSKKSKLYQKSRRGLILLWSGRVAAILILAFAVFTLLDKSSNQITLEKQLAKVENNRIVKDKPTAPLKTKVKTDEQEKEELVEPQHVKQKIEQKENVNNAVTLKKTIKKNIATIADRKEKDLEIIRVPVEIPPAMKAITASINILPTKATMGIMSLEYPNNYDSDERLLADNLKEKLDFKKIKKVGLDLFTSISNKKFSYETDLSGKVTKYKYDSRLLAFSIPNQRAEQE